MCFTYGNRLKTGLNISVYCIRFVLTDSQPVSSHGDPVYNSCWSYGGTLSPEATQKHILLGTSFIG